MTPQSARSVKRWQARAAVLRALPSVCPDEVRELIAHTRRAFTPAAPLSRSVRADQMFEPDEDDEFNDSRREHTVRVWAARHGLDREWLIGPLWSMMNWAHVQKADVLVDADLWVQQIWQIEDFSRLELEKLDLMNTWRNPIAPKPSALPREKVARAAHQRAWLRQCREWAEQTTPLQPIEADPSVEREEDFVARARAHYQRRAEDMQRRGWYLANLNQYLPESAGWFLQRQVLLRSPETIGGKSRAETVRKRLLRFATLLEFGPYQPLGQRRTKVSSR